MGKIGARTVRVMQTTSCVDRMSRICMFAGPFPQSTEVAKDTASPTIHVEQPRSGYSDGGSLGGKYGAEMFSSLIHQHNVLKLSLMFVRRGVAYYLS